MQAKRRLGLVFFPAFDWEISKTHPERKERLLYTMDQLEEEGLLDMEVIKMLNPMVASEKDLQRVHFCVPDVGARVSLSHSIAAGGAIRAGQAKMSGEVDAAFALVRPPGHHAHRVVHGDRGFCIINTEAVMIESLRQRYGPLKVAIVDTDCHHGDGTQDVYYNDRDTLFVSIHQDGRTLYPGSGGVEEMGGPSAYGYNVNLPLPPHTGEKGFLYVMQEVVLPILKDFQPDLIVNSAGQDNHYTDPLTNMRFTAQGYAQLTRMLKPDVSVLEGGYAIEGALPYVNLGIILAMAGLDFSSVREPDYDKEALLQEKHPSEYVKRLSQEVLFRWKNKEELFPKDWYNEDVTEVNKSIFYDTDNIREEQTRRFYRCNDCSGMEETVSATDDGRKVLAICIPRDACLSCQNKASELYEQAHGFTHVYLQDRPRDRYQAKGLSVSS